MRAGAAEVEITPQPGAWLTGYSARTQPATGVHDPLFARALVIESDGARVGLGVADIIGFDDDLMGAIRERAARQAGIAPAHLMLAATHTHSAPSIRCLHRMAPAHPAAIQRVVEGMSQAIAAAAEHVEQAAVGAAFAEGCIGVNRRRAAEGRILLEPNPSGPVDRQVGMLRVEGARGLICVMLNHACHGVVLGPDNYLYSADWPGAAARALRAATGAAVAMVTNGACGDINPAERGDFDAMERQGAVIAGIGLGALNAIELQSDARLRAAVRPVALPTRALSAEEAARELERCDSEIARARAGDSAAALRSWEIMRPWAQEMAELAASGRAPEPVRTEVQALAVGDIALVGLPGEVFVEIGMNIRAASPFAHTFIIGYANRSVGYLPTRQAFAEGGYEVETAHRFYGFPPFTPEVQGIIESAGLGLLEELR